MPQSKSPYRTMERTMRAVLLIQKSRARTLGDAADLLQSHLEMSRANAHRVAVAAFDALGLPRRKRERTSYPRATTEQRAAMAERMRACWKRPEYRAARARSTSASQGLRRVAAPAKKTSGGLADARG